MIPANTHFGSVSKNGPNHNSRTNIKPAEITEVTCVFPPVCSCITDLDSEHARGMQLNKEPTIFEIPFEKKVLIN